MLIYLQYPPYPLIWANKKRRPHVAFRRLSFRPRRACRFDWIPQIAQKMGQHNKHRDICDIVPYEK